jgi:hypothetical protein
MKWISGGEGGEHTGLLEVHASILGAFLVDGTGSLLCAHLQALLMYPATPQVRPKLMRWVAAIPCFDLQ